MQIEQLQKQTEISPEKEEPDEEVEVSRGFFPDQSKYIPLPSIQSSVLFTEEEIQHLSEMSDEESKPKHQQTKKVQKLRRNKTTGRFQKK